MSFSSSFCSSASSSSSSPDDFRKNPPSPLSIPKKSCLRKHLSENINMTTAVETSPRMTSSPSPSPLLSPSSPLSSSSSHSSSHSLFSTSSWLSASLRNEIKKRVEFDLIEIREFPIILGDNPSPRIGIPITIGWKPQRRGLFDIDYYEEQKRSDDYCHRRYGKELIIPSNHRTKLAIIGGANLLQIGQTAVTIMKIQKHRAQSSQKGTFELFLEGLDRKLHPPSSSSSSNSVNNNRNTTNRKQQQHQQQQQQSKVVTSASSQSSSSSSFSRVPNEAPSLLSSWKANGERFKSFANAAA